MADDADDDGTRARRGTAADGDAPDEPGGGGPAFDGRYLRDLVGSVALVLLIGLVLVAVSGVWPPMVAVESGSMEPNLDVGDLVFVVDNDRYTPAAAPEYRGESTGVVPADRAAETGRTKFGGHGDVVVFVPNGDESRTPIIHRAMLWVEEGENWYGRADRDAVGGANGCEELNHCPAPHAGFITLGDANPIYDQQTPRTAPVRPEWIVGTAEVGLPYLGYVRLAFAGQVARPPGGDGPSPSARVDHVASQAATRDSGAASNGTATVESAAVGVVAG